MPSELKARRVGPTRIRLRPCAPDSRLDALLARRSAPQVADTWDKCIENTLRKVSYGTLAGALVSLVLFRARRGARRHAMVLKDGSGFYAFRVLRLPPSLARTSHGLPRARPPDFRRNQGPTIHVCPESATAPWTNPCARARAQAVPRAGALRSSLARASARVSVTPNAATSLRRSRSMRRSASEPLRTLRLGGARAGAAGRKRACPRLLRHKPSTPIQCGCRVARRWL